MVVIWVKNIKGYRLSSDACEVLDRPHYIHAQERNECFEVAIMEYGRTILPWRQGRKKKKAASVKTKIEEMKPIAVNVEALLSGLEIELLKFKIYSDVQ